MLEKPENLSFLAKIFFELSQKKTIGGVKLTPPPGQIGLKEAEKIVDWRK